jgi:DNA invertase Pin-like site-specific DNA recombinase
MPETDVQETSASAFLPIPAAEYVRMSTEHQRYSTDNQRRAIREYAEREGMTIVQSYADEGRSGLSIVGRDGLAQLLSDVENHRSNFTAVLVYDVSRWGRFQDIDESAYYEYICKRQGIKIHYCAEQFQNDGSPIATILKSLKRAMAAEYSRELSTKVLLGHCRLIQEGFRQGGPPGVGLRRMLCGVNGEYKGILGRRERKGLQSDRIIIVPGPPEEIEIVRSIYRMFRENLSKAAIVRSLQASGAKSEWGVKWSTQTITEILTNEKYIGTNVYLRTSFKLKKHFVNNPPEIWIRKLGAFEPIISPEEFYEVQALHAKRNHRVTNDELLDHLRNTLSREGQLSAKLLCGDGIPNRSLFRLRFSSLGDAYKLVGYKPPKDFEYVEINRELHRMHSTLTEQVIDRIHELGGTATRDPLTELLTVNSQFTTYIFFSRCGRGRPPRKPREWRVPINVLPVSDVIIVIRMAPGNKEPLDYFILPQPTKRRELLILREKNGPILETHRHHNLDYFFGMVRMTKTAEAI